MTIWHLILWGSPDNGLLCISQEVIFITGSDYEIVQDMARVISSQINKLIEKAPFDKTFNSVISTKKDHYKYTVMYNGTALDVSSSSLYSVGDSVKVCIPHGDNKKAYIVGVTNQTNGIKADTLIHGNWSDGTYSFEDDFPLNNYFLQILPSDTATLAQVNAFINAKITYNSKQNIIKAVGTVPTNIDIPIIIQWIRR